MANDTPTDDDYYDPARLIEEAAKAIREVRTVTFRGEDGYLSVVAADDETLARAALEVFEKAHTPTGDTDYYDPARQDRISEHECIFEDGVWWFGHGMPCKHPKLHAEPQSEPSDAQHTEARTAFRNDPASDGMTLGEAFSAGWSAALRAAGGVR